MNMLNKIFLFLLMQTAFLMAADAQQILNNLRDKYSSMNDFSAEIKQEGKSTGFSGMLFYKKDNKFRVELKNMTIISDGDVIWNYNKKQNRLVINEVDGEQNFPFSFETLLNDYPAKSNLSAVAEGKFNILTLTPKSGSGLNFKSVRLWINESNLVERILIENQEQSMDFSISDYKLNQNLADSRFKFSAPEGSKVIDLR